MLVQLPEQQQTHGGLDLPGCDSRALVVMRQARCLASDALENVLTKEFMIPMALEEMQVSGWTGFSTLYTYAE